MTLFFCTKYRILLFILVLAVPMYVFKSATVASEVENFSSEFGRQGVSIHIQLVNDDGTNENKSQGSEYGIMKDHTKILSNYPKSPENHSFKGAPDKANKIMVLSSQGGAGKSTVTFILANAISHAKFRVLLVNLDRGNLSLRKMIGTVIDGYSPERNQFSSDDNAGIVYSLAENLDFLDYGESTDQVPGEHYTEIDYYNANFRSIISSYDCVLFDTHTGLNELNLSILQESNIAILVSTPDAVAISDTYTLIKASYPYTMNVELCLVINQVLEKRASLEIYKDLNHALQNFMERDIKLLGLIQADEGLKNFPGRPEFIQNETGKISALSQIEDMAPKLLNRKLHKDVKWA